MSFRAWHGKRDAIHKLSEIISLPAPKIIPCEEQISEVNSIMFLFMVDIISTKTHMNYLVCNLCHNDKYEIAGTVQSFQNTRFTSRPSNIHFKYA